MARNTHNGIEARQLSAPANPVAGNNLLYPKSDGKWYSKDSAGVETLVGNAPVTSVAGKTGVVTLVKADVGLSNVDNTTDAAKPVSTAQQTALNGKADVASPAFTGEPTVNGSPLVPLRDNLVFNPSFEEDWAGWGRFWTSGSPTTTIETDLANVYSGSKSAKVVLAGNGLQRFLMSPVVAVAPGEIITLRVRAKTLGSMQVVAEILTRPAASGDPDYFAGDTLSTGQTVGVTSADGWKLIEFTVMVPAGHDRCRASYSLENASGAAQTGWLDSVAALPEWNPSGKSVSERFPPGVVQMYVGSTSPTGWLMCVGNDHLISAYPDLAAVIGTAYVLPGDPAPAAGYFRLPDMRNLMPRGAATLASRGTKGGSDTKTIAEANLPAHSHTMNHGHTANSRPAAGALSSILAQGGGTATIVSNTAVQNFNGSTGTGTGSGTAMDVVNAHQTFNFIIKT